MGETGKGAAPKYLCTYYDIVDYLNISSHNKLHTYILPKINLEPVEVTLDFMLVAILSVVEKLQTVSFYFVLNLEWQNPFATWDPLDFCNISEIILPMDTYWSPPIFILERVNGQDPELNYMVLTHNGSFNSTRPFQVTLTCSLIILKFPFDTQTCNLSIASFLYPAVTDFVMKTRRTPAEIMKDSQSFFLTDGEWKFTNLSVIEYTEILDDKHFSVVTYLISMERRPTLYILNLILPTCALYLLDMAVLFGPSSLEEKINFQIAIILGSSMLAVILNNSLPTSSNKPPIIGNGMQENANYPAFCVFLLFCSGVFPGHLPAHDHGCVRHLLPAVPAAQIPALGQGPQRLPARPTGAAQETPRQPGQGGSPTAAPSQEGPGTRAANQAPLAAAGARPISASSGEGASLQPPLPVPVLFYCDFCKMEQLKISSAQCQLSCSPLSCF
ncbi:5-hydroxytryptamine receptor 3A-like isoform X1 [Oenanthe melanoleuca]|uniref:5-hydroxytryptamine receptor 3A-like isoform X1 n=1 Tax=Oenanthe melanoleuca TaxID=2939378 RepID=UPI0024C1B659|nr:5-hydroxytryptamine receptor 3A-like isoform X1 [Oenanthe melanoleuca]